MWCRRPPRAPQSERPLNTIWPLKVANQAANGSAGAWLVLPARWPTRHRISGGSDKIAKRQSGPAASLSLLPMAAGRLKTGQPSRPHFFKKWGSTRVNMLGRFTVTHIRTTTAIFGFAGSVVMECYGIRSTARSGRSRHAPSWRLNLT